ncbi:hypothetical protein ACVWZ3_009885 [Bradyrhizobium sp. i1.3.6]
MQLGLPFAERVPEPVSYVWLLACESRFEEAVAARFRQRAHAIVDGRDGRPVVLPQDVILLHRSDGSFLAFGPVGVDGDSVLESIRRFIFISRNVVAREPTCDVIGLFFGRWRNKQLDAANIEYPARAGISDATSPLYA